MAESKQGPTDLADSPLDAAVRTLFAQSWGKARSWIETGKIFVNGARVTDSRSLVSAGAEIQLRMNAPKRVSTERREDATLEPHRIVYSDTQIVVVDKPAGISTV